MQKASAQLWGGPQDGLIAAVEVGKLSGPPEYVDVPESPQAVPLYLFRKSDVALGGVDTVRYRLDLDHASLHLLYRIERPVKA